MTLTVGVNKHTHIQQVIADSIKSSFISAIKHGWVYQCSTGK